MAATSGTISCVIGGCFNSDSDNQIKLAEAIKRQDNLQEEFNQYKNKHTQALIGLEEESLKQNERVSCCFQKDKIKLDQLKTKISDADIRNNIAIVSLTNQFSNAPKLSEEDLQSAKKSISFAFSIFTTHRKF